jgi:hypothetical protein
MSYPQFSAGDIMDIAAAMLNDPELAIYTYAAQIPYLQTAVQELQEYFEQNNIPVTNESSAVIEVDAGVTEIGFVDSTPAPNLPDDLVEIRQLWYSPRDQNQWLPMTKREYLPHYLENQEINALTFYTWKNQIVSILPANEDNDIKFDYIKPIFPEIVDENTILGLINGKTFLEFRTAGLIARFVGENPTRADQLDGFAVLASDRATGIGTKGRQSIPFRRRPFRAGFKRRGF